MQMTDTRMATMLQSSALMGWKQNQIAISNAEPAMTPSKRMDAASLGLRFSIVFAPLIVLVELSVPRA